MKERSKETLLEKEGSKGDIVREGELVRRNC